MTKTLKSKSDVIDRDNDEKLHAAIAKFTSDQLNQAFEQTGLSEGGRAKIHNTIIKDPIETFICCKVIRIDTNTVEFPFVVVREKGKTGGRLLYKSRFDADQLRQLERVQDKPGVLFVDIKYFEDENKNIRVDVSVTNECSKTVLV